MREQWRRWEEENPERAVRTAKTPPTAGTDRTQAASVSATAPQIGSPSGEAWSPGSDYPAMCATSNVSPPAPIPVGPHTTRPGDP